MEPIAIKAWNSILPASDAWDKLRAGQSCLAFREDLGVMAGSIPLSNDEIIAQLGHTHKNYKQLDRSVLLALLAADGFKNLPEGLGVNMGSSRGATQRTEQSFESFLSTNKVPTATSPNTTLGNISSWVGHHLGTSGIALSHSITCSTGLHAILNGAAWINSNMASHMLCGASEAPLTPYTVAQMQALKIYSPHNHAFPCESMVWDKTTNSMVLGEAAAAVLLGKPEKKDGLFITGMGWGTEHIAHPADLSENATCLQKSMQQALSSAGLETVDAIVMHAPGTVKGDVSELNAIKRVFSNKLPALTSNKWCFGHTFATSGMLNVEMAIQMLQNQSWIANPIQKFTSPQQFQHILVNAVGFGGNAVSVVVSNQL